MKSLLVSNVLTLRLILVSCCFVLCEPFFVTRRVISRSTTLTTTSLLSTRNNNNSVGNNINNNRRSIDRYRNDYDSISKTNYQVQGDRYAPTTTKMKERFVPTRYNKNMNYINNNNNNKNYNNNINVRREERNLDEDYFNEETSGGSTVKQRWFEDIEFPFRTVRLLFFGSCTLSAITALYFSLLNTAKAYVGGYNDVPPLQECLQNDVINIIAIIVCVTLITNWKSDTLFLNLQKNNDQLASSLFIEPASPVYNYQQYQLLDLRGQFRVVICVGGESYIRRVALSLTSDQMSNTNILPQRLAEANVVVIPVLLTMDYDYDNYNNYGNYGESYLLVSEGTKNFWNNLQAFDLYDDTLRPEYGRNFDITRANEIIAFPRGVMRWSDYLEQEIDKVTKQGYDVLEQGITITMKENGKIMGRATPGLPQWKDLIGTSYIPERLRY